MEPLCNRSFLGIIMCVFLVGPGLASDVQPSSLIRVVMASFELCWTIITDQLDIHHHFVHSCCMM